MLKIFACLFAVTATGLTSSVGHATQSTKSTYEVETRPAEFVSCRSDIKDSEEVLALPDPIIKCGGMANRLIEQPDVEWHYEKHYHDGAYFSRGHGYVCHYATTESGYRGSCAWESRTL